MISLLEIKRTVDLVHDHGRRVGSLAFYLSRQMGLPDKYCFLHYIAGRWHDFGKLVIPQDILNTPGKLTAKEWEVMKKHPIYSYALVNLCDFTSYVKQGILYHHEDYAGSGYPLGLTKGEIPLSSRILRICDMYDALVEDRIYRPKFDCNSALTIMDLESANGKLDPHVYPVFKTMVVSKIYANAEGPYARSC